MLQNKKQGFGVEADRERVQDSQRYAVTTQLQEAY